MNDVELAGLVRQGQRYWYAAQQDEDPVVEHLHLNYAFTFFEIAMHGATRARIHTVTGVDIDSVLAQVQASQESAQRELLEDEEVGMMGGIGFGQSNPAAGLERQYLETTIGPIGTPIICGPRRFVGQESPSSLLQDWLGTFRVRSLHFEMQPMGYGEPWKRHAYPATAEEVLAAIKSLVRASAYPIEKAGTYSRATGPTAPSVSQPPRWGTPAGYDLVESAERSSASAQKVARDQGPQMLLAVPALREGWYIATGVYPAKAIERVGNKPPWVNLYARMELSRAIPNLPMGPAMQDPVFQALAEPTFELASIVANIRSARGVVLRYIQKVPESLKYENAAYIWKSEAAGGLYPCFPGWLPGYKTHYRLPPEVTNRMQVLHDAINIASSAQRQQLVDYYATRPDLPPPPDPPTFDPTPGSGTATTVLTVLAASVLGWLLWRQGLFKGPFLRARGGRKLPRPALSRTSTREPRSVAFRVLS